MSTQTWDFTCTEGVEASTKFYERATKSIRPPAIGWIQVGGVPSVPANLYMISCYPPIEIRTGARTSPVDFHIVRRYRSTHHASGLVKSRDRCIARYQGADVVLAVVGLEGRCSSW